MLKEAKAWVDKKYADGAREIGVSCNPIQRKLFLYADDEREILTGGTQREVRIIKDILHDYIAALPSRAEK